MGFFLAAIPWYVGAIIMLCSRVDYREKPGYIACIVAVSDSILSFFHLNPVSVLKFCLSLVYI